MAIIQFMLTSFIWISSSTSIYNWSKRGVPSAWAINPDSWSMSFIVAISSMRIEGLMASTSSIISKSFWLFIKDVMTQAWRQTKKVKRRDLYLIIHHSTVAKNFKKFANENEVRWITIPTYTPQLNPAEKIIAVIKSKIRKQRMDSKIMSLNKIKEIVDEISKETWEKWIKSSMLESYKYSMLMKNSESKTNFGVQQQ